MALIPGLNPNIRLTEPEEEPGIVGPDIIVEMAQEGGDVPKVDEQGNILEIEHSDGSITVSLDGRPIEEGKPESRGGWFDNLVEKIDDLELGRISDDLIRGIDDDKMSRKEWIEDRANGMKLLGLKVELPALQGATDGAAVEGISRVRHPLLLEACLRFQANSRSELLPTDGPIKIRNDNNNATLEQDQLSDCLERDMNHYLTSTATEYYPDTDRMLLMLGFGGSSFKKVYYCPLRNRPISESVDAEDVIVSWDATDLHNAKRVTHRSFMKPSTVKRLQILGVYRDIELSTPLAADLNAVDREKLNQQGISQSSSNQDDRDREIYECYCELSIKEYEHKHKGRVSGLDIPYIVTIDASTKKILSVVRNYDEDDKEMPEAKRRFVKFSFNPGFGFYDLGLLHILGNTTNAVTAAWREMLDAGMYASFPGFLMADTGARQNTNIFRIPPGGGALVKTGGMPLQQAIMPIPYRDPSSSLMSLCENIAQTGMRVGGTSEQAVGEGKQDAPVGTTIALIEQAQKILNAVHKRLHAAQAQEFQLLKEVFKEHPESFWQSNRKPAYKWDEETFLRALEDVDLVPQADPNTASHTQRIMKVMALKQLATANPTLYDPIAVDTAALQAMGWSNPQQFFAPASSQGKTPPEVLKGIAELENKKNETQIKAKKTDADIEIAARKLMLDESKLTLEQEAMQQKYGLDAEKVKTDIQLAERDLHNRIEDRAFKERLQLVDLAQNVAVHPDSAPVIEPLVRPAMADVVRRELEIQADQQQIVPGLGGPMRQ